jgi:uncharacterized protein DUF5615
VAKFSIDANIPASFAGFLQASGHDVMTARQLGLTDAPDDKHLLMAAMAGRILITHDEEDFILLQGAWLRWTYAWGIHATTQHAGILVLPQISITLHGWLVQTIERLLAARLSLANELHLWDGVQWVQKP